MTAREILDRIAGLRAGLPETASAMTMVHILACPGRTFA